MTEMHISKHTKIFDNVDYVVDDNDDTFDECVGRNTDEKIKRESYFLNAEDDIFDEALECKIKINNSNRDIKSELNKGHAAKKNICSKMPNSGITISSVEDKYVIVDRCISGEGNFYETNKVADEILLETSIKHEEVYEEVVKLEHFNDSIGKPSVDEEFRCTKCSFQGSVHVLRKHLRTHNFYKSNKQIDNTQDNITNMNSIDRDTKFGGSILTQNNKNIYQMGSDEIIIDLSLNDVDISQEVVDNQSHQVKTTADVQLTNGELKEKCNLMKLRKNKSLDNDKHKTKGKIKQAPSKIPEPNTYCPFGELQKHGEKEKQLFIKLYRNKEIDEMSKNLMKVDCTQPDAKTTNNAATIFVSQNADSSLETEISTSHGNDKIIEHVIVNLKCVSGNTDNILCSKENDRLIDTINRIKCIIYEQDSYKTNGDKRGNDIIEANSNENEILAATLSQIKNIICKEGSLVVDNTKLSTNELPTKPETTVTKTDESWCAILEKPLLNNGKEGLNADNILESSKSFSKKDTVNKKTKAQEKDMKNILISSELLCPKEDTVNKKIEIEKRDINNILKSKEPCSKKDTVNRKIEIGPKNTNKSKLNVNIPGEKAGIRENRVFRKRKLTNQNGIRGQILQLNEKGSTKSEEDAEYSKTDIYGCILCSFTAKRTSIVKRHYLLKHDVDYDRSNGEKNFIKIVTLTNHPIDKKGLLEKNITENRHHILERSSEAQILQKIIPYNNTSVVNSKKKIRTRNPKSDNNIRDNISICRDFDTSSHNSKNEVEANSKVEEQKLPIIPQNNCPSEDLGIEMGYCCTKCTFKARRRAIVKQHLLKHGIECSNNNSLISIADKLKSVNPINKENDSRANVTKYKCSEKRVPKRKYPKAEKSEINRVKGGREKTRKTTKTEIPDLIGAVAAMKLNNSVMELTNQIMDSVKDTKTDLQNLNANELTTKILESESANLMKGQGRNCTTSEQSHAGAVTNEEEKLNQSSTLSIVNDRYSKVYNFMEFERFFNENNKYKEIFITDNKEHYEYYSHDEQKEIKPVSDPTIKLGSINKDEISPDNAPPKKKVRKSENVKLHSCDKCSYKSPNIKYVTRHKIFHLKNVLKCSLCNYITNRQRNLAIHNVIHRKPDEVDLYRCTHCSYTARRRSYLKDHMTLHLNDPFMYQCDKRDYRTKKRSDPHVHKIEHKGPYGLELFKCGVCGFATKRKGNLNRHMVMHQKPEDIYWYNCDECPFRSKFRSSLFKHKQRHRPPEEVNIHVCSVCQYRTKYRHHLRDHSLLHKDPSELRMFECLHCSYKSVRKRNLLSHTIQHKKITEINVHKCTYCSFASRLKHNLNRHIKCKHSSR